MSNGQESNIRVIVLHADDLGIGSLCKVRDILTLKNIHHVIVPSEVSAGSEKHSFVCEFFQNTPAQLEQNDGKLCMVCLISDEFSVCSFCKYCLERALHENCAIIPITVNRSAVPNVIAHIATVDINRLDLREKILESIYGIRQSYHELQPDWSRYVTLELQHSQNQPIHVRNYWRNRLATSPHTANPSTDYSVPVKYHFTAEGNERRDSLDLNIEVSEDVIIRKVPTPEDAQTSDGCSKTVSHSKDIIVWWCDREKCPSQERKFWFRFKRTTSICHIFVTLNLTITELTTGGQQRSTVIGTKTITFITKPRDESKKHSSSKARTSGTEADAEYDVLNDKEYKHNSTKELNKQVRLKGAENPKSERQPIQNTNNSNPIHGCNLEMQLYKQPKKRIYTANGLFSTAEFCKIMSELEELGDNSTDNFEKFHKTAQEYMETCPHIINKWIYDCKIAILIKMASVAHYRNRLKESKAYSKQALALLPRAHAKTRLEARISYYMSAVYRERKKWGKAEEWIHKAQEKLDQVDPCEDTAKGYYNAAKLYAKMLTHSSLVKSTDLRNQAKLCFEQAIEYFLSAETPDPKQVRRCLLNMASIVVYSPQTAVGRNQRVEQDDITEAKRVLMHLHSPALADTSDSIRQCIQVQISESEVIFQESRLRLAQCASHNPDESLMEQRCTCKTANNSNMPLHHCDNIKEGLLLLKKAKSQLNVPMALSEKCSFKEAKSVAQFATHMEDILRHYNVIKVHVRDAASGTSCETSSDQAAPSARLIGVNMQDISDAYGSQSDASVLSEL